MKILYIANIRLPTEKAHGVQIMKMCEAFAKLGHAVELVVPDRKTPIAGDPFTYYGIATRFPITRLPVLDTTSWGPIGFALESLLFARRAVNYLRTRGADLVYGRDEMVLWLVPKKYSVIWETHTGAWNMFAKRLARRAVRIAAISHGLKDFYVAHRVPAEKVLVAHDGIDLDDFAHPEQKGAARERLGLPKDKQIVMYIGRLDGWKGSETLLEASELLSEDIAVAIIGGEPAQLGALRARYPKVTFLGFRPYCELADNQAAADVLVLPNTGKDKVSAKFTSPLKLFSYMASGVPIVASDLPSIREVLDEQSSYFFKPDDPESLAQSLSSALADSHASARSLRAKELVKKYTWVERANSLLQRYDSLTKNF